MRPSGTARLAWSVTPAVDSWAVITANADLWTANAGYNQDIAVAVNGSVVAWKESGGFAGTFSPNAASMQAAVPVAASTPYAITLRWKANRPDPGSIFAGAGPIAGEYSPTRLTVQLIPNSPGRVFPAVAASQYSLAGSNGSAWNDTDAANLTIPFMPPSGSWLAYISGNADLWTSSAGYNQDLAINLNRTVVAWKESGGFAGTFSPNAAFVQAVVPVSGGTAYSAKLQWKSKRADPGKIWAGAGPIGGSYSPSSLIVVLEPVTAALGGSTQQYSQAGSDGATWKKIDGTLLQWTLSPGSNASYMISGGADLWTSAAGFNQDVGIMVSGGAYGSGTLVAWKESGGFAGTFSPNAAFVATDLHLKVGNTYTVWLVWKANRRAPASSAIWAGAGPIGGSFSQATLTALQL